MAQTFGVIEGTSYTAVLTAADRATKAADVRVVRYERVGEHDMAAIIAGETADIQLALQAAHDSKDGVTTALLVNTGFRLRRVFGL